MIKIFDSTLGKREHFDYAQFFDINAQPYQFTNQAEEKVDFTLFQGLPKKQNNPNSHCELWINVFHNTETGPKALNHMLEQYPNVHMISNYVNLNHERHTYIDFVFNRTKAYYSQYPFRKGVKKWYYHGTMSFVANPLVDPDMKRRIFVAPNKTYQGTRIYRTQLVRELKNYSDIGHLACCDDEGTFLYPHMEFPYLDSIDELLQSTRKLSYNSLGYCPPHNAYYQDSFISIYGETIEYGDLNAVTEKTYDPLIKGHFILPFSAHGFIKCLREKGIQLPSFIDYSYDDIENADYRFEKFKQEMKRLLSLPMEKWRELYHENMELLYQNQVWFSLREYDRVDLTRLKI